MLISVTSYWIILFRYLLCLYLILKHASFWCWEEIFKKKKSGKKRWSYIFWANYDSYCFQFLEFMGSACSCNVTGIQTTFSNNTKLFQLLSQMLSCPLVSLHHIKSHSKLPPIWQLFDLPLNFTIFDTTTLQLPLSCTHQTNRCPLPVHPTIFTVFPCKSPQNLHFKEDLKFNSVALFFSICICHIYLRARNQILV